MTARNYTSNRQSIRISGNDYTQSGAYFITLCTQNRECLFGNIVNGEMCLNDAGQMIQSIWYGMPNRFPNAEIDQSIIMPNHIHGIIILHSGEISCRGEPFVRPIKYMRNIMCEHIHNVSGEHKVRPYGTAPDSIGRIIQAFKSITTHQYAKGVAQSGWTPFIQKCWQRNYWERIIRNDIELQVVRQYISANPEKWQQNE